MRYDIYYTVCQHISPQGVQRKEKNHGNGRETAPLRRSGRERDGTGTKPGNATAGRNDGRQGGNKELYYAEWGASEALVPS